MKLKIDVTRMMRNIIDDVAVELADEFDQNFNRQAFFDRRWKPRRDGSDGRAILMNRGSLRKSVQTVKGTDRVKFVSALPYARIHNEGGTIPITKKMRKFAWAMYYRTKQSRWKGLALTKQSRITIPQRQFLGDHPIIERKIREIINDNIQEALSKL